MKNTALKIACFEKDIRQKELAKATGVPESYVSLAVNGKYILNKSQMLAIANYLEANVSDIFPSFRRKIGE